MSDPYRRHRFDVDVGDDRPPLGFTEVRGLAVRDQTRPPGGTDDERDWSDRNVRLERGSDRVPSPSGRRAASPALTLRRGVTDDRRLWDWLRDWTDGSTDPRDVRVFLLDAAGDRARGWRCRDATPVRWAGPELAADRSGVATETLELAHRGIEALADAD